MSELKVNSITSKTGTGIKINSPVGINTNAPSSGMNISGKLNVIDNNLEVTTVSGSSYGLRIKAPPSNTDAVLQFSNFDGTPRATISSNVSNDLIFSPGGQTAAVMSGNGIFTVLQKTLFKGISYFNGNAFFNKQATFSQNAIPKSNGVPVLGEHLVNLLYLKRFVLGTTTVKTWSVFGNIDNGGINGCCKYFNGVGNVNGPNNKQGAYTEVLPGKWLVVGFSYGVRSCSCHDNESFHFPIDNSAVWQINGDNGETVRTTIAARLGTPYNAFGFAIRIGPSNV
jgi:hypothetical protein